MIRQLDHQRAVAMVTKSAFSTLLLGLLIGVLGATDGGGAEPPTVATSFDFLDGFETPPPGSWPTGWTKDANANDGSNNYVDNTVADEGSQSLRLFGAMGGCWAAIAYHPLTVTPPFTLNLSVRNGNDVNSGCHPDRGWISLREGTSWVNPVRTLLAFMLNGDLQNGTGGLIGSYNQLQWYRVSIEYERPSPTTVQVSYWVDGSFLQTDLLTSIAAEDQLTNLDLTAQEGAVWFDNVSVSTGLTVVDELTREVLIPAFLGSAVAIVAVGTWRSGRRTSSSRPT